MSLWDPGGVRSFTRPASVSTAKLGPLPPSNVFQCTISYPPPPHLIQPLIPTVSLFSCPPAAPTQLTASKPHWFHPWHSPTSGLCNWLPPLPAVLFPTFLHGSLVSFSSSLTALISPARTILTPFSNLILQTLPAQLFSSFSPSTILSGNEGSGSNFLSSPPSMTSGTEPDSMILEHPGSPPHCCQSFWSPGMRGLWGWLLGVPEEIQGDTKEAPFQISPLLGRPSQAKGGLFCRSARV